MSVETAKGLLVMVDVIVVVVARESEGWLEVVDRTETTCPLGIGAGGGLTWTVTDIFKKVMLYIYIYIYILYSIINNKQIIFKKLMLYIYIYITWNIPELVRLVDTSDKSDAFGRIVSWGLTLWSDDDRTFTLAAEESFTLFTTKLASEGFSSVVGPVEDVDGRFKLKLGLILREWGIAEIDT